MPAPTVRPPVPCRLRVLLLVLLLALAAGCTGGSEATPSELAQRLRAAKQSLDQAASIDLTLQAERLPPGVSGVAAATGVVTHAPAFRGQITVAGTGVLDGQPVEVVAVGGEVYAQTPFSSAFVRIDPAAFNAPDPARLMDPRTGLSTLPTEATGLAEAGRERAGEQVLTAVTGEVPGSAVARTFPSAARDRRFDATFWLDGDDRLQRAELTGRFYAGAPPVTYTLRLQPSDEPVEITPP